MALTRNLFGFVSGLAVGVYLAQNYSLPDIRHFIDLAGEKLKELETALRK